MDPEINTLLPSDDAAAAADATAARDTTKDPAKPNGAATAGGDPSNDPPARPGWLTEDKFWDADKGFNGELAFTNYKELREKFARNEQDVPDAAAGYELPGGDEYKELVPADDPMMKTFRESCHEAGLNKDQFNQVIGPILVELKKIAPAPFDGAAELARLGSNGAAIVREMADWGKGLVKLGHLNDTDWKEFQIATGSAEGVRMLNKIRAYYDRTTGVTPKPGGDIPSDFTTAKLQEMVNDDKYGNDVEYTRMVDDAYAKRYGTEPAISSARL